MDTIISHTADDNFITFMTFFHFTSITKWVLLSRTSMKEKLSFWFCVSLVDCLFFLISRSTYYCHKSIFGIQANIDLIYHSPSKWKNEYYRWWKNFANIQGTRCDFFASSSSAREKRGLMRTHKKLFHANLMRLNYWPFLASARFHLGMKFELEIFCHSFGERFSLQIPMDCSMMKIIFLAPATTKSR